MMMTTMMADRMRAFQSPCRGSNTEGKRQGKSDDEVFAELSPLLHGRPASPAKQSRAELAL
jgi:hypothetical protein